MNKKVAVIRREHFNAAHRLYNEDWSNDQNMATFGKCSLPHYHGHNYELEIKVTGEIDPVTGFVMDLKELSDLVNDSASIYGARYPDRITVDIEDDCMVNGDMLLLNLVANNLQLRRKSA